MPFDVSVRDLSTEAGRSLLGRLRISDICLALFTFASVAFDDGSVVSQLARILIVAGAITESTSIRFKITGYHIWLFIFTSIVFISRFWAFSRTGAENLFNTVFFNFICLSCVAFLVYDDLRRVRLVVGCMAVAPIVLELRVILTGGLLAFLNSRATGSISANSVGMFSAFGIFFAYALYRENRKARWLLLSTFNLCIALLSASRKAIMVIALVALLLAVLDSENKDSFGKFSKVALLVVFLLIAAFLVMNVPFLYELVGIRLEGMINGFFGSGRNIDASTKTRMDLVAFGIDWFREKPFLGYGADGFRHLMSAFHPGQTAFYAHNNYVELLVSYGLIGMIAYYFIYLRLLVIGLIDRKRMPFLGLTAFCLLIGLLVMDYGLVDYYSRDAQLFIVLVWTILIGFHNSLTLDGV